jgi:FG-GAP repeat
LLAVAAGISVGQPGSSPVSPSSASPVLTASSPGQRLKMQFTTSGATLSTATARVRLGLRAIGYGSALSPVTGVDPVASTNRVTYRHGGLSEWYVNGPLGLEQGFTITAAAKHRLHTPLTLAIGISGNARPTLARDGQSVVFEQGGKSALTYSSLRANDASGRSLPSHMELSGGRLLLHVDTSGARYPLRIDPLIQQGPKLTGSPESAPGRAGESVAVSADGNTALVAAPSENGLLGAVFVFTRSGSTWTQQAKLTAKGETAEGFFGSAVALSGDGNTALIGASQNNGKAGAAWIFNRVGATWTESQKIVPTVPIDEGEFGSSVALSSDDSTAAIGIPGAEEGEGTVETYKLEGSKWNEFRGLGTCEERPTPPGVCIKRQQEKEPGLFGSSVALSADGSTVMVGMPKHEPGTFFYTLVVETLGGKEFPYYHQQGPKIELGNCIHECIALSGDGNTALVGGAVAPSGRFSVSVLTRSEETWSEQALLTGTEAEQSEENNGGAFGSSVALSADGNTALIGAPEELDPVLPLEEAGSAWEFTRTGSSWSQSGGKLIGGGEQAGLQPFDGGEFGWAVALSADGRTGLIGGPGDHKELGAAWVFSDVAAPAKEEPKPPPPPPLEKPKPPIVISAAQIAAALAGGIVPSGQAAKIAALLKHGSFAAKFAAPEAGLATISWFEVPPGAKLAKKAKPKPVLVASGRLSFTAPGSGLLKLKLTNAGKRLLKHAKRLKLVARGSFTPSSGSAVTATRTFLLKR